MAVTKNFFDEITRQKEKQYRNSGKSSIRFPAPIPNQEYQ